MSRHPIAFGSSTKPSPRLRLQGLETDVRAAARAWTRFWFKPSQPDDLGVARVLFFSGLLAIYGFVDVGGWGRVSPAFWMPLPLFHALHLGAAGPAVLELVRQIWLVSLAASAIGFHTRPSMVVAFLLGTYLLGLPHNFGHTFHFDATLVIAMGILACSRAGDAWSLDRALAAKKDDGVSGEYTWPIRAIWVAMALVFFAAGLAKLRHGGLEWITSDNLSIVLNRAAYHVSDADPVGGLGLAVARHAWLSRGVAAITVLVELGFAAALFSPYARLFFVPAAFGMLIGIRILMGPTFGGFLILNVFWVPWSAVLDSIAARVRLKTRTTAAATSDISSTL